MEIVSSFEWYKLRSIIQLLDFMQIDDFIIISENEYMPELGFHLYVDYGNVKFVRELLYQAEINKFLNNK